jgi:hypothetical protein
MNWPFDLTIIAVAVSVAAAIFGIGWWLWWALPKQQVNRFRISDPKTRADIEDNLRKTSGQLLGGAAVLIGAALAYLQFSQQQKTSQQQFSGQQQASRDLLITNQVAKGFELMGNKDNPIQQLGGIYALEGVMKSSEQYHQPVLEALCAFVRDRTKTETGDGPPVTAIQAALTVIGRRPAIETDIPDLRDAHIPRADLRQADLRSAYLFNADLRDADLRGADLRGAILLYPHILPGGAAYLADLQAVHLTGADLRRAEVAQAQLDQACGTDVKLDPGLKIKPCP